MKFAASILVLFSGLYLINLSISPVYIAGLGSLFIIFLSIIKHKKYYFNRIMFVALTLLIYLICTQFYNPIYSNAVYNVLFSLFYLILLFSSMYKLPNETLLKISRYFINTSIPILIAEAFWRITHPRVNINTYLVDDSFYRYKFSSFMYQDSNFVGIFIVTLFFLCVYLKRYQYQNYRIQMLVLFILAITTFSRAAILTIVIFYLLYGFKNLGTKVYLSIIIGGLGIYYIWDYIDSDLSFISKLDIIKTTFEYFQSATLPNTLFGVGFGNSIYYLNIGAHNFFVAYLVESGIIGFALMIGLFALLLVRSKYKVAIVMIPFLFNGLSLSGHAITFFYCACVIIFFLENEYPQKYQVEKSSNFS